LVGSGHFFLFAVASTRDGIFLSTTSTTLAAYKPAGRTFKLQQAVVIKSAFFAIWTWLPSFQWLDRWVYDWLVDSEQNFFKR